MKNMANKSFIFIQWNQKSIFTSDIEIISDVYSFELHNIGIELSGGSD